MLKFDEEIEKIRDKFHKLTADFQLVFTRVALIELNLMKQDETIKEHDVAIKKIEKFMYTMIGISIGANVVIELVFKLLNSK